MIHSALLASLVFATQFDGADLEVGTQPGELVLPVAGSSACSACHRATDQTPLASSTYRATMMDLAGVDPFFLAATEIAYRDIDFSAELCIRCHFPQGWLAGRGNGTPESFFGLVDEDKNGITCDFCHRMEVPPPIPGANDATLPDLTGVRIANSQIFLRDDTTKVGPHGSNVSLGHPSVQSALMKDSVLCAQCHDVTNTFMERVTPEGQPTGTALPIERTYSEWSASDYSDRTSPDAKSCFDCHMTAFEGKAAILGDVPVRELARHDLVGANTVTPKMVAWLYEGDQNAPAFLRNLTADAERVCDEAERRLQDDAATLEAKSLIVDATGAKLKIRVTNRTGHKLPTGYAEGRRMWVSHDVQYADGSAGPYAGLPDPVTFDFVDNVAPAQTWEILLGDGPGQHSFHFVTVDRILKDTRIPPKGFVPNPDTAPVAYTYPDDGQGRLVNYDEVLLPLGESDCWPVLVDVKLHFQAASGSYYRFLVANSPTFGPDLQASWEAVGGGVPVEMQSLSLAVFPDGRIENAAGPYQCLPAPTSPVEDPGVTGGVDGGTPAFTPTDVYDPSQPYPEFEPVDDEGGCRCVQPSEAAPSVATVLAGLFFALRRRRAR